MRIIAVFALVLVCLSSLAFGQDSNKQPFNITSVLTTGGGTPQDEAAKAAIRKLNTNRKLEPEDARALIEKTFNSPVPRPEPLRMGASEAEQAAFTKASDAASAQEAANAEALKADYCILHIVQWKTEAQKGSVVKSELPELPQPGSSGSAPPQRGGNGVPMLIAITAPGQRARLTFEGSEGRKIGLSLQAVSFSPDNIVDLAVVRPDGTTLLSDRLTTRSKLILIPSLPETGSYAILIDPQNNTGSLSLALSNVPDDLTGTISPEGGSLGRRPEPREEGDRQRPEGPAEQEAVTTLKAKLDVIVERWYLYKRGDDGWKKEKFEGLRLYGSKRVAFLAIHLDADPAWQIGYDAEVRWKLPDPFKHAFALAGALPAPTVINRWGGGPITIKRLPVDINLTGTVYAFQETPKEFKQTYDNEGRYFYDFSVGLPVKNVRELKFDATDNVVRTKEVDQQKAFAFVNLFYPKVDTKDVHVLKNFHFLAGIPLTGKPLNHPVVGTGFGINKLQVFFGLQFNKEQRPTTLSEGDLATQSQLESQLRSRWVRKFVMGVNIPIFQFLKAKQAK